MMEKLQKNDIQDLTTYCGLILLKEGMTVSPLKLQKMLYYIQAWMMVFYDRQLLFDDKPQSWVNGPVYPSVYDRFRSIGRYDMMTKGDFVQEGTLTEGIESMEKRLGLTTPQLEVLRRVIAIYGAKNQDQLVFMTHCEAPWSIARGNLGPFENSDNPISFDDMYSFYRSRYDANRKARSNKHDGI